MKAEGAKSILFLTSTNISSNPRLLKAYQYWESKGLNCEIVSFKVGNWSDKLDDALKKKYKLKVSFINANKQEYFQWLTSSLINKILSCFNPRMLPLRFIAFASNKRSWQLLTYLKSNGYSFDKIEAHTLASLYPAYVFAKSKKKVFDFDVEDYHPGEKIKSQPNWEKYRRLRLMTKMLPKAKRVTAASPLIAEAIEDLCDREVSTINNSFHANEFYQPEPSSDSKMQFVWFSLTISYGRGLEEFINASKFYKDQINVDLVGSLDPNFETEFIQPNSDFVKVIKPIQQQELHKKLRHYDVGLALEMRSSDFNREICLTNKLFAFAQAGLYLFATDTLAQKAFLQKHQVLGVLCQQNRAAIQKSLAALLSQKNNIRAKSNDRFEYAKQFDFIHEMEKLDT